jgi:hypothetical protein
MAQLLLLVTVAAVVCAVARVVPLPTIGVAATVAIGGILGWLISRCRWGAITGAVFGLNWATIAGVFGMMWTGLSFVGQGHDFAWILGFATIGAMFGGILGGWTARLSNTRTQFWRTSDGAQHDVDSHSR